MTKSNLKTMFMAVIATLVLSVSSATFASDGFDRTPLGQILTQQGFESSQE